MANSPELVVLHFGEYERWQTSDFEGNAVSANRNYRRNPEEKWEC
jgi:hypothetical protein